MEEILKYLKALTFLKVEEMTAGEAFGKPEVLLARAGFSYKEIAEVLGKSQAAVAKTVQRAT